MSEFNFSSQVCTSRSQSERLLALGLKKETADTTIHIKKDGHWYVTADPFYEWEDDMNTLPCLEEPDKILPAWSLHRLIEMLNEEMYGGLLCIFKDSIRYEEIIMDRLEAHFEVVGDNMYENVISCIEWLIKEGYFNKEYLED